MSQPPSVPTSCGRMHRLQRHGTALAIRVDGEPVVAFEGETVLTALLASRTALRRFEFGPERRAGFCLIGACQDCWVHLVDGTPVRACTTRVTRDTEIRTNGGG